MSNIWLVKKEITWKFKLSDEVGNECLRECEHSVLSNKTPSNYIKKY